MSSTWSAIYLGHSATFMDPYEGDNHAENADSFVGNTYGSADDPLAGHIVDITAQGNDWRGRTLDTNNARASDKISYDLGGGEQAHEFDTAVTYEAVLTYTDCSQVSLNSGVLQDTSGNLFLIPSTSATSSMTQVYEAKAIQSIELGPVQRDNHNGLTLSRHDTGFVCFAAGSLIDTPQGARPVEALRQGDLVDTLDHGPQPILWTGARRVLPRGANRAYRIMAGALGGRDSASGPDFVGAAPGIAALCHHRQNDR